MSEKSTITFGQPVAPTEAADYKERISRAKAGSVNALKGNQPVGGVERPVMPILSQLQGRAAPADPFAAAPTSVQPRAPGSPVLRPETAEQLSAFQAAQSEAKEAEEKKEAEKEKAEEDVFGGFDFFAKNEAERILNNRKRRKDIESRCAPMALEDLVMNDEVQQTVPIVPGKFEPRYRSPTPDESLAVKAYLSEEKVTTEQYMMEKYGLCQLTCALVSINGVALPSHLNPQGEFDGEAFKRKLRVISKKSAYVVADLGLNFFWFDLRVRRLLNPEALGNG